MFRARSRRRRTVNDKQVDPVVSVGAFDRSPKLALVVPACVIPRERMRPKRRVNHSSNPRQPFASQLVSDSDNPGIVVLS